MEQKKAEEQKNLKSARKNRSRRKNRKKVSLYRGKERGRGIQKTYRTVGSDPRLVRVNPGSGAERRQTSERESLNILYSLPDGRSLREYLNEEYGASRSPGQMKQRESGCRWCRRKTERPSRRQTQKTLRRPSKARRFVPKPWMRLKIWSASRLKLMGFSMGPAKGTK